MKQVKPSVLIALILTVLIGYFEPANAKSMKPGEPTVAYVALNSTTGSCPFWPNPVAPTALITTVSVDTPNGGYLINLSTGQKYGVSISAYDQPFPLSVVETNNYFPKDEYNSLTGTTLNIPQMPGGNYTLTVTCTNGNSYTTKVTYYPN